MISDDPWTQKILPTPHPIDAPDWSITAALGKDAATKGLVPNRQLAGLHGESDI